MAKVLQGSCNWCGSCCGYGAYSKCALPYAFWKWDTQHPGEGLPLVKAVKAKVGEDVVNVSGKVALPGVGSISFYLSEDGLQVSETDNTCPFYNQSTKECKIWDNQYIPNVCKQTPQNVLDEKTDKWSQDHPSCGFYWENS